MIRPQKVNIMQKHAGFKNLSCMIFTLTQAPLYYKACVACPEFFKHRPGANLNMIAMKTAWLP
ncbi:MAG: hypothetical protein Q7S39_02570, partial [Ignavibacteria bacterium]|nr:hypothetical protein [Ignavibacteria bacterium]